MPSAIVGMVLALGITVSMAAIALPAFIDAAQSARELAEAQAKANREALACVTGEGLCAAINDGTFVCETWTNALNGHETTECRVVPKKEAPGTVTEP